MAKSSRVYVNLLEKVKAGEISVARDLLLSMPANTLSRVKDIFGLTNVEVNDKTQYDIVQQIINSLEVDAGKAVS